MEPVEVAGHLVQKPSGHLPGEVFGHRFFGCAGGRREKWEHLKEIIGVFFTILLRQIENRTYNCGANGECIVKYL